ncbi:hypothetical protein [Novosphingobium sp. FSW06-99]|uniref:hypothetical protein n=1 Tax=Novosphingobium sp. FSW06-99 TaxID=1739113 RepID=UPI000A88092A|nr:hypothetical protein [Novosphingobium sp. FSW06-99]
MATLANSTTFEVNIALRQGVQDVWNVEAIDTDGSIEQAIFAGPRSEERAREYAQWEYDS